MNARAEMKAIAFCMLILFSFLGTPVAGAQKAQVIKIATLAPEGSSWIQTFNAVNEEISKKTNNQVRFRIYPGGVLGDEKDMIRKMYIGQIQGAVLTSSGLSAIFHEMDVFQIPFLFKNYEEVDYVIDKMDAFFKKGFDTKGYIMLGWSEGGFVRLMSTVPVDTLDKLKKAKVWTWEDSPMAKAVFNEAQVMAIPLSVPDVLVGLQTGLVDVVYAPPSGAIAMQWFTKTKYITDVPLIFLVGALVVKKNVFQKISPEHQKLLRESFQQHMDQLKRVIRKENQDALQVMAKHGVKILKPSQDQIKEFKDLSDRAMKRLGKKSFSKKTREAVEGHLKTFRGENKQ
ncbi:MAG: TRAP transporter substrate-binding protein DctP [Desulfobacterales bacterium]|nr:MAG: TRAP transporter substrate-binding protein DctP [Desulfobacterales bacterium]